MNVPQIGRKVGLPLCFSVLYIFNCYRTW